MGERRDENFCFSCFVFIRFCSSLFFSSSLSPHFFRPLPPPFLSLFLHHFFVPISPSPQIHLFFPHPPFPPLPFPSPPFPISTSPIPSTVFFTPQFFPCRLFPLYPRFSPIPSPESTDTAPHVFNHSPLFFPFLFFVWKNKAFRWRSSDILLIAFFWGIMKGKSFRDLVCRYIFHNHNHTPFLEILLRNPTPLRGIPPFFFLRTKILPPFFPPRPKNPVKFLNFFFRIWYLHEFFKSRSVDLSSLPAAGIYTSANPNFFLFFILFSVRVRISK